jgi:selenocysteine-specific elongation factor
MTAARKNVMLGTAGHVDHGKTALVKMLTGCETDTLAAEKQRGLTIELGFAPCQMADERIVGIVDVPGHVNFVRNMVAGAHGVDVVVLVVAADDGVMPQTREHLDILTLMGCRHGFVALTKIDLVDDARRQEAVEQVRGFLRGTFLEGAAVCPVSNVTGEGFDGFLRALNEAVAACEPHEVSGLFRLWVERSFKVLGFGAVVSGIPSSGEVREGDRLRLLPGRQVGRVRRLEVYGSRAEVGRAGECVALNLTDVDPKQLSRGKVLAAGDAFQPVRMFEAELRLLDHVPRPLEDYVEVHLHVGTAEAMAHVALLEGRPLPPGGRQMAQLRLLEPLPVAAGDRFVLRMTVPALAEGGLTTVAGGRVLGTSDLRLRRRRPWTLAALVARRDAIDTPEAWAALHLKEAGDCLSAAALARRARMPEAQVRRLLERLRDDGIVLDAAAGQVVHRDTVQEAAAGIVRALRDFRAQEPMRLGLEAAALRERVEGSAGVFELAVSRLREQGVVQRQGDVLVLPGSAVELSEEDRALGERIEAALREAEWTTPSAAQLAGDLGAASDRVERMLRLLADQGVVVRLAEKLVMHREAVAAARQVALDLFAERGSFTTMDFRDALGVSRKYAVPLLDHFDAARLTVRSGNRRTPGAEAKGRS